MTYRGQIMEKVSDEGDLTLFLRMPPAMKIDESVKLPKDSADRNSESYFDLFGEECNFVAGDKKGLARRFKKFNHALARIGMKKKLSDDEDKEFRKRFLQKVYGEELFERLRTQETELLRREYLIESLN